MVLACYQRPDEERLCAALEGAGKWPNRPNESTHRT
jgi:hypothetical protein